MRILHLIEAVTSPPSPAALALLGDEIAADGQDEHVVWAVGPAGLAAAAERVGVAVDAHLPAAGGRFWPAWWTLRRALRRGPGPGSGETEWFDLIHAGSLSGAALAGAAEGRPPRLATVSHTADIRGGGRWIRRVLRRRPATLLALDDRIGDDLTAAGLDPARVHTVEPAIDPRRLLRRDRRGLRMSWGVTEPNTRVVAVLADPPWRADAMSAMLGVGLAAETGRPLHMLLSPSAGGFARAERVARATGRTRFILPYEAADRPWEVLNGCDMAVVLGGGLSMAWAMAAGSPIITPDAEAAGRYVTHERTALLPRPGSAGELARAVCRLCDNPRRADGLGAAARREAERRFHPARYAAQLRAVYEQVRRDERDEAAAPRAETRSKPLARRRA